MEVEPKTRKELMEALLHPEGKYYAKIIGSRDHVSSKGNKSIRLEIELLGGVNKIIHDYVSADNPYSALKFLNLVEACDLMDSYNNKNVGWEEFRGKYIQLSLGIQKSKDPQYPDRNIVKDYIVEKGQKSLDLPPEPVFPDDEVPF